MAMKQRIEQPNEEEIAWVRSQIDIASSFVETYAPGSNAHPPSLTSLDISFAAWIETKPTDPDLINFVINGVGIAFGSHLVDGLGLKWVIATDDQGSDLAVYGLPARGDVLIYPANFVAKRWERREVNFLERSFRLIEEDLRKLKDSYSASDGRTSQ
jgi:hypothetical protein